jgi:hypothetical protein
MKKMESPNKIAETINKLLMMPLTEKEIRISMVEIINPEFRMTLWNSSVWKNENNNKITSAMIKILKNCSKKILLIFLNEIAFCSWGCMMPLHQLKKEYMAIIKSNGTNAVAIHFLALMNFLILELWFLF